MLRPSIMIYSQPTPPFCSFHLAQLTPDCSCSPSPAPTLRNHRENPHPCTSAPKRSIARLSCMHACNFLSPLLSEQIISPSSPKLLPAFVLVQMHTSSASKANKKSTFSPTRLPVGRSPETRGDAPSHQLLCKMQRADEPTREATASR
jgi:hypothetical protein